MKSVDSLVDDIFGIYDRYWDDGRKKITRRNEPGEEIISIDYRHRQNWDDVKKFRKEIIETINKSGLNVEVFEGSPLFETIYIKTGSNNYERGGMYNKGGLISNLNKKYSFKQLFE